MAEDRTTLTSPSGVKIVFEQLKPSESMDVIEAAGSASDNQRWLMLAFAMASVRQVGDLPILFPKDKADIKAIADRLGDGHATVLDYAFGGPVKTVDAVIETAKN